MVSDIPNYDDIHPRVVKLVDSAMNITIATMNEDTDLKQHLNTNEGHEEQAINHTATIRNTNLHTSPFQTVSHSFQVRPRPVLLASPVYHLKTNHSYSYSGILCIKQFNNTLSYMKSHTW